MSARQVNCIRSIDISVFKRKCDTLSDRFQQQNEGRTILQANIYRHAKYTHIHSR
jgi:hypothetical protein